MHTWGEVQLWRVAWDSYVRSPTFVAREISNDRFTIPEPVLPLTRKWRVTHYPKVTKKKKENKQGCSYKLTRQTKGYSLYGVYLRLLPQTSLSDLLLLPSSIFLYLFWWGSFLGLALASFSITISTFFYCAYMFNCQRICARIGNGENLLRSICAWGGIFYLSWLAWR